MPPRSVLVYLPHLSSAAAFSKYFVIVPLPLARLRASPVHPCLLFLRPRLTDALHLFLPLRSILPSSSSSPPLPSPLGACLSWCRAARREDTLMLSLLGWHNSPSLWGVKALTLPCLSVCLTVCAAPLSAPVKPSWLTGWYSRSCPPVSLPACPTSCRGEWSCDKGVCLDSRFAQRQEQGFDRSEWQVGASWRGFSVWIDCSLCFGMTPVFTLMFLVMFSCVVAKLGGC